MLRYPFGIFLLVALLTTSADASCICRCLDGRMQPLCSSENDMPAFCDQTPCPHDAPVANAPTVPTVGKRRCFQMKKFNPQTGLNEWQKVCR